jgi:hypothetical protein
MVKPNGKRNGVGLSKSHTLLVFETLVCAPHRLAGVRDLFLRHGKQERRDELKQALETWQGPSEWF